MTSQLPDDVPAKMTVICKLGDDLARGVDWRLIATIGIPSVLVVAGWFLARTWLTARRELASRKREARLKALEAAYMRLANSHNRLDLSDKNIDDLETFVAEIQLYGTPNQILLTQEIVEAWKKPNNRVVYDAILKDLRDTLRRDLSLEPITGEVWWLRINRSAEKIADASTPRIKKKIR